MFIQKVFENFWPWGSLCNENNWLHVLYDNVVINLLLRGPKIETPYTDLQSVVNTVTERILVAYACVDAYVI